jgi:hypothetical protein
MAVTFSQEPLLHTPASNPILFAFSSDETGQPNFSYKVELFINSALFGTYELYPMFGTYAKFDASEYLRSFVATHMKYLSVFAWESVDQAMDMQIIVHESYGTPPALEASATSTGNYAFNGALRYTDFIAFNSIKYWIDWSNAIQPNFLTTYPDTQKQMTPFSVPFLLGILANRDNEYYELRLKIYDITGTETYSNLDVIDLDLIVNMLDISPQSMVDNGWAINVDFNGCYYYEVEIFATKNTAPFTSQSTLPFRLYLDQSCQRFETQRLYWMNKFGVIDQFDFNMYSEESTSINSYGYQVQPGEWIDGQYGLSVTDSEKRVNMKSAEDRITLNTDWMKPAVQNWLVRELYESPQVWLYKDFAFQPVILENKESRQKSRFKDGLIQETVVATITWSYRSQLN